MAGHIDQGAKGRCNQHSRDVADRESRADQAARPTVLEQEYADMSAIKKLRASSGQRRAGDLSRAFMQLLEGVPAGRRRARPPALLKPR